MFTPRYCLPLLLLLAASPAAAQTTSDGDQPGKEPSSNAASNLNAATASHTWAPSLPTPPVAENAPPVLTTRLKFALKLYGSELMIFRYSASLNAFKVWVVTFPSELTDSMNLAQTSSLGNSAMITAS